MKTDIRSIRQSYSLRAAIIGFLILVLLIPLTMVGGVVHDRRAMNEVARHDIMRSWGQAQTLGGPILVIPYKQVTVSQYGERLEQEGKLRILPATVATDVVLETTLLERGIYEVPVYTAQATIRGEFPVPDAGGLGIETAILDWSRAYVSLAVSDAKAIRNTPEFASGDQLTQRSRFESGGAQYPQLPPQIVAPVLQYAADPDARQAVLPFSIELEVSGTDSLQFIAMAESTQVNVESEWPSPSFTGAHLPEQRTVSDDGFSASWRVSNLGRTLPSRWTSATNPFVGHVNLNAFGLALYTPVSLYHVAERATKYGILFIGLTFVGYFLFEVIAGLRLHPLQYLMVGFANTLFYLLLLSLAEHIGFGWSYLVSAVASSGMITGYSAAILGTRSRALLMLGILGLLYAFLYLTLNAESFAMLAGSIGLWLTLALIMYLTRGIDWYQRQPADDGPPAKGAGL